LSKRDFTTLKKVVSLRTITFLGGTKRALLGVFTSYLSIKPINSRSRLLLCFEQTWCMVQCINMFKLCCILLGLAMNQSYQFRSYYMDCAVILYVTVWLILCEKTFSPLGICKLYWRYNALMNMSHIQINTWKDFFFIKYHNCC